MIPASSTTPMSVDDVKHINNWSTASTTYDTYISNNLYPVAVYANDYTNNGLAYDVSPTDTQYTTLISSGSATSSGALLQPWLVNNSVVVFSSDESTIYDEDHDYSVDFEGGYLWYLAGSTGGTSTGGSALIHYQFINPVGGAKVAIAQLLKFQMENDPKVASESIGPMSRSYVNTGGDIPGPIKKMLNPYRKPRFA